MATQNEDGPTQFRRVFVTWNSPPITPEEFEELLRSLPARYWCCSAEVGENGTLHYHGYCEYRSPTTFDRERRRFPGAHIDVAKSAGWQLRDYVAKQGKHADGPKAHTQVEGSFKESGQVPRTPLKIKTESDSASDKKDLLYALVEQGLTAAEIVEADHSFIYRVKAIEALVEQRRRRMFADERRDVRLVVLMGPTGCGKTSWVYDNFDSVCRITSYREKGNGVVFDAMDGQECLCLDEFNSQIPVEMFNTLTDRYPLDLPARYYDRCATYSTVVVCTNRRMSELYEDVRIEAPELFRAFLRRISEVRVFDKDGSSVVFDGEHAGEDALAAEGVVVPERDWLRALTDEVVRQARESSARNLKKLSEN